MRSFKYTRASHAHVGLTLDRGIWDPTEQQPCWDRFKPRLNFTVTCSYIQNHNYIQNSWVEMGVKDVDIELSRH